MRKKDEKRPARRLDNDDDDGGQENRVVMGLDKVIVRRLIAFERALRVERVGKASLKLSRCSSDLGVLASPKKKTRVHNASELMHRHKAQASVACHSSTEGRRPSLITAIAFAEIEDEGPLLAMPCRANPVALTADESGA